MKPLIQNSSLRERLFSHAATILGTGTIMVLAGPLATGVEAQQPSAQPSVQVAPAAAGAQVSTPTQQSPAAQSQVLTTTTPAADATLTDPKIPNDQLDSLVAPIALYPDPLLAQTLAASTYPLE